MTWKKVEIEEQKANMIPKEEYIKRSMEIDGYSRDKAEKIADKVYGNIKQRNLQLKKGDRLNFDSDFYEAEGTWEILDTYDKGKKLVMGKVGKRGNVLKKRNGTRFHTSKKKLQNTVEDTDPQFNNTNEMNQKVTLESER